jgi:hypothetical protein
MINTGIIFLLEKSKSMPHFQTSGKRKATMPFFSGEGINNIQFSRVSNKESNTF